MLAALRELHGYPVTVVTVRGIRAVFTDEDAACGFAEWAIRRGLGADMHSDLSSNVRRTPEEVERAEALVGQYARTLAVPTRA